MTDNPLKVPIAGNLPRMLLDAIKRTARVHDNPASFPELTGQDVAPATRFRRRRAERLRAVALVMANMIRRADRRTLRVGSQRPDGLCTGITIAEHAEATGLSQRRVSRALAEGEGKYWFSKQPVVALTRPGARRGRARAGHTPHAGLPSVRTLTPLLFKRLGITDKKLARARSHGAKAWAARRAPPASVPALRALMRTMRDDLAALTDRSVAEQRARAAAARLERIRQVRPPPKQ